MGASFAAIVTAAGSSARMRCFAESAAESAVNSMAGSAAASAGIPVKKEYLPLGPGYCDAEGKPLTVLGAAVSAFARLDKEIGVIVVTVPADGEVLARAALPRDLCESSGRSGRPAVLFTGGGPSRRDSVYRALSLLRSCESSWTPSWVLIHDGARPWISADLIKRVMDAVVQHGAVVPLAPLLETPKEIDGGGLILKHLRRSSLGLAQTPQAFAFPRILRAHQRAAEQAAERGLEYTDDAEIWGEFCGPVATVAGERGNRKITYLEDLA